LFPGSAVFAALISYSADCKPAPAASAAAESMRAIIQACARPPEVLELARLSSASRAGADPGICRPLLQIANAAQKTRLAAGSGADGQRCHKSQIPLLFPLLLP
jgi:hypothetical protein